MRRTIHITGKIEPFFGTLDENIRLLEDSLQVRTHLHDTRITVEGEQDSVDQAVRIVEGPTTSRGTGVCFQAPK